MQKYLLALFSKYLYINNINTVKEFILTLMVQVHTHQTKRSHGPEFRFCSFPEFGFSFLSEQAIP